MEGGGNREKNSLSTHKIQNRKQCKQNTLSSPGEKQTPIDVACPPNKEGRMRLNCQEMRVRPQRHLQEERIVLWPPCDGAHDVPLSASLA